MTRARVVVTLIWATAWVLVGASPAGASEETVGSCVVEAIEDGGGAEGVEATIEAGHASGAGEEAEAGLTELEESFEDCLEAPNPILPETNEIIWGTLSFLILLGAMIRWGFPLVRSSMEGRTERIRADLDAAEAAHAEAAHIKQEHVAELAETKASASKVIDEARQEAAVVRADLQAKAEADIVELRRRADVDVEAARQRALADLQTEVNEIVVGAAERVVEQNLDRETQKQLIDNYIASVGRR